MSPAFPTSHPAQTTIRLPDLISHCKLDLHIHRNHKLVSVESRQWLLNGDPDLCEDAHRAFRGLNAGMLASMCCANVGYPQLRVYSDFVNWFFHLDNLSDDMDDRCIDNIANIVMNTVHHPYTYHSPVRLNRITKDFYKRVMQTASPGTLRRWEEVLELFFHGVKQEARDRANGTIPDFESYISVRRDTSGCKSCFALIEYAHHLNIPDDVMDHPIIRGLNEAANDSVWLANDIFSYDNEQSKGQTHNMIDVIMNERGLGLQEAVDFVGDYSKHAIDRFTEHHANLPSWDPAIDADVRVYVGGLANWIVGSINWSFETERYFGKNRKQVKTTLLVTLRPKIVRMLVRGT